METLEKLGIKEEYEAECKKALKVIAEDNPEVAEAIAKDIDGEVIEYMCSRAMKSITKGEPTYFIMGAFSWADSEKGDKYWAEMTCKFCESHPMVSEEILESELMTNSEDFSTKENMANDTVLWGYKYMLWGGCVYKVTGDFEYDGRGVRNIKMTLIENYRIVKEDEEDSIKCNKCGSTNVSIGSFGDRTGVNCRDCGESRLVVD